MLDKCPFSYLDVMWTYHVPSSYLKFRELHFSLILHIRQLCSEHKDLDEGIKSDNSGCIFKKKILPTIPRCLSIRKIFYFAEPCTSRIVRIKHFAIFFRKCQNASKTIMSPVTTDTRFNISRFVLTKVQKECFFSSGGIYRVFLPSMCFYWSQIKHTFHENESCQLLLAKWL